MVPLMCSTKVESEVRRKVPSLVMTHCAFFVGDEESAERSVVLHDLPNRKFHLRRGFSGGLHLLPDAFEFHFLGGGSGVQHQREEENEE